jgi:hypothetical protein
VSPRDQPLEKQSHSSELVHEEDHGEIEPVTIKLRTLNEQIAEEMQREGYEAQALPVGSTKIESLQASSQMFGFGPRVVTNRGLVRVSGRNFSYVQVIQRS